MAEQKTTNLDRAKLWTKYWNEDVDRMVNESYGENAVIQSFMTGQIYKGRDELRVFEYEMLKTAPKRWMEPLRYIASDDTVVAEILVHGFGEHPRHCCVILTFKDGFIVSDHTYAQPAQT